MIMREHQATKTSILFVQHPAAHKLSQTTTRNPPICMSWIQSPVHPTLCKDIRGFRHLHLEAAASFRAWDHNGWTADCCINPDICSVQPNGRWQYHQKGRMTCTRWLALTSRTQYAGSRIRTTTLVCSVLLHHLRDCAECKSNHTPSLPCHDARADFAFSHALLRYLECHLVDTCNTGHAFCNAPWTQK
jgi:hypothetical protein